MHLFGAGSSPEFSNLALKRTAEDSEREFGARTDETLRKNFYVDDVLKSAPTKKEAVELVQAVKEVYARGRSKLTNLFPTGER